MYSLHRKEQTYISAWTLLLVLVTGLFPEPLSKGRAGDKVPRLFVLCIGEVRDLSYHKIIQQDE